VHREGVGDVVYRPWQAEDAAGPHTSLTVERRMN